MLFFEELKRRNVFRVAIAYMIIAWLILQVGDTLAPALHLPDSINTVLVFFLILGFPLAIFLEYYHNGQYGAALAEAQIIETGDFRAPTFLVAVNGQLGRVPEAKRALSELRMLYPGSFDDINQELIQRNGFAPELAGHIVEGLRKAESKDSSN